MSHVAAMTSRKREREQDEELPDADPAGAGQSTTNFRSVSACNRCRTRKNRCDQRLPRCTNCEKVGVSCVGFDPVSKRAIPRNYVYYLETRVRNLEALLKEHNVPCPPPSDDFGIDDEILTNVPYPPQAEAVKLPKNAGNALDPALQSDGATQDEKRKLDRLASNIAMVSVQGSSTRRPSAHNSGIPFSRVMQAAVKGSRTPTPSERGATKPAKQLPSSTASGGGGSDSFFGLNTRPTTKPAPFPEHSVGLQLIELYFEHANPQIPILHRGEFASLVERVYATEPKKRRPRELYLLNIVFAIGSGIIMDSAGEENGGSPNRKRQRLDGQRYQPDDYHSAAIVHLDSFLGSNPASSGASGGLEELQAVLLLAGLALLRPVAPGLWYIIGVAVRLAVDLGLHSEDIEVDGTDSNSGKRQWTRDMRRRLWWCTYAFDRLVSTCVGRPFGISDQVVTTEFPSLLDDSLITPSGLQGSPLTDTELPSYKRVAHHYFRLRLLQSEILQVLQHRQASHARALGANMLNRYMYTDLASPFLSRFHSFRDWRADVDRRLLEWRESAPDRSVTGVAFQPLFLELNYWQAIILLYRQSLTVPEPLAGEVSPSTGEVQSPGSVGVEAKEDEELVFMKVAQAGQTVLKIYRQLHRMKLVNYTFLATHHIFMSGISFLYAIWHSTLVRSQLSLDDVDFTVLIATSVLGDLISVCSPAEACRDAFTRMSKATISMVMSTTGFGNTSTLGSRPLNSPSEYFRPPSVNQTLSDQSQHPHNPPRKIAMPQFDMHLKDLFTDTELAEHTVYQPEPFIRGRLTNNGMPQQQAHSDMKQDMNVISPQSSAGATDFTNANMASGNLSYQVSNQSAYQPFDDTVSPQQPQYTFDDLGFLDAFPAEDPNGNAWTNNNDFDLGFGTGGTRFDGNGAWDANAGPDLFEGFFFGAQ